MNVSAKDLGTGKEQKITVTGTSNLSEDEIKKMQKEAEIHSAEDKKKKEEIETINEADTVLYTAEKSMKEMEGKVDASKLKPAKDGLEELKKLMEPEKKDIDAIRKKLDDINKVLQEAATEMYQKAAAEQQADQAKGKDPGADGKEAGDGKSGSKKKDENVVDAEYTVEDEGKKDGGKK